MKHNKKISMVVAYSVISSLVTGTLFAGLDLHYAKAAAESTLYFSPSSASVTVGSNVTLTAKIDSGSNALTGVMMYVTYDKDKFSLSDSNVACATLFSDAYEPGVPSPADGTARLDCMVPSGEDAVSGTGVDVATFTFTALTSNVTNSSIAFTNSTGASAEDEDGNVLIQNATGATVTITGASTSSNHHDSKKKKKSTPKWYISQSKNSVVNGQILTERGKKFSKNSLVLLYFSKFGGGYYAPVKIMTAKNGSFSIQYRVNKPKGIYKWYAVDTKTGKKSKTKTYKVKK